MCDHSKVIARKDVSTWIHLQIECLGKLGFQIQVYTFNGNIPCKSWTYQGRYDDKTAERLKKALENCRCDEQIIEDTLKELDSFMSAYRSVVFG
ncbi:MAG: hypothetical protein UT00_C0021G0002 [Parcubacteria group bacterium GW2011_GWA1_38_7]|nr:MAG: hypothetical protein UT00_C0021G0002 [Parcubacteria group bacterium GW2011_GWA1_38_7]